MMNLYTEASVEKKVTAGDTLIKFATYVMIILIMTAGVFMIKPILILVGIAGGFASFYLLPRLRVTYEYVFCDGQIDFDKIMAGEYRKHLYRTDFENVLIMAPTNSHSLDSYKQSAAKTINYSSLFPDRKVYCLVESAGEQTTLIYFEPDEKMLSYIKQKAPRKLSEY